VNFHVNGYAENRLLNRVGNFNFCTMKKNNAALAALSSIILLNSIGCTKVENRHQTEVSASKPEDQKIFNYLVAEYKFNSKSIEETPDDFIVEGDMVFAKKDFWKNYKLPETSSNSKHYRSYYKVSPYPRVIDVSIDPGLPAVWRTAYANAITKWNSVGGKITFKNCLCSAPDAIRVTYAYYQPTDKAAYTRVPTADGNPGNESKVNLQYQNLGSLTANQKLALAVHELGHAIGLMHTDNAASGYLITTGTSSCNTNTNSSSIMREVFSGSWTNFSTCDKAAFKALYP
jgi:hypothetical protein